MRVPDADEHAMRIALAEARAAALHGDVPVGAVVVGPDGEVVARAHNRREVDHDPTAHAELLAIGSASRTLGSWRLEGCSLVVTLEPCPMCAGACVLARVSRLVIGADDPKAGAAGSVWDLVRDPRLNHRPEVMTRVLAGAAERLLEEFFAGRRRATE